MVKKEPYCYAPFIGLNITTGSNVDHEKQKANPNYMYYAPCCAWQGKFYNGPIEELYKSEYWKNLEKDMMDHNIDNLKESCQECIKMEKSNLESDRQNIEFQVKTNYWYDENLSKEEWKSAWIQKYTPGKLSWLDYRPSNTCNLRCRMCSAGNSNLIAKDENVNIPISKDEDIYKLDLSNLKTLKILGGEPTIQKEAYNFANYINKKYDTNNLYFQYTTNMTVLNQKWLNLLKKFKHIHCEMSIDGIGKPFEYLRYGAKWDVVEKNIKKLYTFSKNNSFKYFNLKFHVTVGAILMITIEEWLPWFIENSHIKAEFYGLYGSAGGPISILKEKDKEKIRNYLSKIKHTYAKNLLLILNSEEYSQSDFEYFISKNKIKDKLFNTDINQFHQIKELGW